MLTGKGIRISKRCTQTTILLFSLLAKKKEISKSCVDQRSGKPIAPKQVELMEEIERKKETEVCQVDQYFSGYTVINVKIGTIGKYSAKK